MEKYEDSDRILRYEYHSVNRSLVDKLLKYWWVFASRLIPKKMPANLVSILGNLGSWFAFAILAGFVFGPLEKTSPDRPWIFGIIALSIGFYQTLDALDGIQARRTGSSGPLGEFVDHWFDSFNTFFFPLGIALAFPVIPPWVALASIVSCTLTDWLLLREVKETNTLQFGRLSTEEGLVILQLFYFSIWIFGYAFWAKPEIHLGFPPVFLPFFALMAASLLTSLQVLFVNRFAWLKPVIMEIGSLLPIVFWTLIVHAHGNRSALLLGGLAAGFSGSRFVGDLLRSRLMGLKAPLFYVDMLSLDLVLLASAIIPVIPSWIPFAAIFMFLAATFIALVLQFCRAILVVRHRLGTGLFGPLQKAAP